MVLATDAFSRLAVSVADSLGMPDARIAVVPHPIGGIATDVVRGKAVDIVDAVVGMLACN